MKQIFLASTAFEIVCLAAGLDSGAFDGDEVPSERILLLSINSPIVELAPDLDSLPGMASLVARFDRVLRLNDLIWPHHPSSWQPGGNDLPMLERLVRQAWHLGVEPVELVLESPQVNPAIALGRLFGNARIRVHADGLMCYGPTRNRIPLENGQRMTTLHHLPLVPGLQPQLLSEFAITPVPLDVAAFTAVVDEVTAAVAPLLGEIADLDGDRTALGLGQYLSRLGLVTEAEEVELHADMARAAARVGCEVLVFKPHPAADVRSLDNLIALGHGLGIEIRILRTPVVAEVVMAQLRPRLVLGSFSTAMATARAIYGLPALAVGAEVLLDRIAPYQNSNRVPVSLMVELADGTADPLEEQQLAELQSLIDAVAYCMVPQVVPHLRQRAVDHLSGPRAIQTRRHFKRRRLTALGLPGGHPGRRNGWRGALRHVRTVLRRR